MKVCAPLRRGDLRGALLAYARDAADCGRIEGMSLRAAARDLGVSSGAVYKHFCDRDALLKAVAVQGFEELSAIFSTIRPEGAPADTAEVAVARAFAMGRAYLAFADANPALWRMMFGRVGLLCCADPTARAERLRYSLIESASENCRDLFTTGGISDAPSAADVRFLWSAIFGAAELAQSGLTNQPRALAEVADDTTDRSLRALGCAPGLIAAGRALAGTAA